MKTQYDGEKTVGCIRILLKDPKNVFDWCGWALTKPSFFRKIGMPVNLIPPTCQTTHQPTAKWQSIDSWLMRLPLVVQDAIMAVRWWWQLSVTCLPQALSSWGLVKEKCEQEKNKGDGGKETTANLEQPSWWLTLALFFKNSPLQWMGKLNPPFHIECLLKNFTNNMKINLL